MTLVVNNKPTPLSWLVEKTVTVVSVTVYRREIEVVGITPDHPPSYRMHIRLVAPFGSPLGNSIVSAWGVGLLPSQTGKNFSFLAGEDGVILAK